MHHNLTTILFALGVKHNLEVNPTIAGITADSRYVQKDYLFIAINGTHVDGNQYITQALERGAVAVLCSNKLSVSIIHNINTPIIYIANLADKLAIIAKTFYCYQAGKPQIIGITGTNGKTSVSNYIVQGLDLAGKPSAVVGTLGYGSLNNLQHTGMTTPAVLDLYAILADLYAQHGKYVALEVSSHAIDQKRIQGLVFNSVIFTNLTQDHLDYHGSLENYKHTKFSLFSDYQYQRAIINIDDVAGRELYASLPSSSDKISYSLSDRSADIYLDNLTLHSKHITAQVFTPKGNLDLRTQLIGHFNLSNLLACIAVWQVNRLSLAQIAEILPNIQAVAGRMQFICQPHTPKIIIDYAHTPDALAQALQAVRQYANLNYSGTTKIHCIFGCGGSRDTSKRKLMGNVADKYADRIVLTNDNPRYENPETIIADIATGITNKNKLELQPDRSLAIQATISSAAVHDWVLIAGKGHEAYQDIQGEKLLFSDLQQVNLCIKDNE